jgi:predicted DNA-binding protein
MEVTNIMVKPKKETIRMAHSVRLNLDLLKRLKHIAIDENKTIGELVEEGIEAVIKKRKQK